MHPLEDPVSQQPAQDPHNARLHELLAPVVEAQGLFLEDVQLVGSGADRALQVLVDLPEDQTGGVELDDVARASQAISEELDRTDAVPGPPYQLEVSSPGVTRPLQRPRHWRRAIGRTLDLQPVDRTEHGRTFQARLLEAGEESVTLQRSTQVKKGMPIKLQDPEVWTYEQIKQARVSLDD